MSLPQLLLTTHSLTFFFLVAPRDLGLLQWAPGDHLQLRVHRSKSVCSSTRQVMAMMSMSSSSDENIHHVILDSGGIIKGQTQSYHKLGAKFWTVAEVLNEVRDQKARERLDMLPVDLEVRTPSDKAMRAVSSFAKQTGDFAALSLVDLKVMALAYDLECQNNGQTFIRQSPKVCIFYIL